MKIVTKQEFSPTNFVVYNFYGQCTCFAWDDDKLITFPYSYKDYTEELEVLTAPAPIKNIYCYQERIFIVCLPSAIFKVTHLYKFAGLSQSGISLGTQFSEVLTPMNGYLYLEDKKNKNTKQLLKLSSTYSTNDINVLNFVRKESDSSLESLFEVNRCIDENKSFVENVCVVSYQNNVFLLRHRSMTIIYSCDHNIIDIAPIQKSNKNVGALLITSTNIVYVMHIIENALKFDKVNLESTVQTIAASMEDVNLLFIVYSDDSRTYVLKTQLNAHSNHKIKVEHQSYIKMLILESKYLLCLCEDNILLQISLSELEKLQERHDDFIALEEHMLNGLEDTVDSICEKTRDYQRLIISLIESEDELKRINLFANKQRITFLPNSRVQKFLNQKALITNFGNKLPPNSHVLHTLKCDGRTIYSIQRVKDNETIVETPVTSSHLSPTLYTATNLITYANEDNGMWCMIKDYVKDPVSYKENKIILEPRTLLLIEYKLKVLKTLMREDKFDMTVLEDIKQSIRNEIIFS